MWLQHMNLVGRNNHKHFTHSGIAPDNQLSRQPTPPVLTVLIKFPSILSLQRRYRRSRTSEFARVRRTAAPDLLLKR